MLRLIIADTYQEFVECCNHLGFNPKPSPRIEDRNIHVRLIEHLVGYTPDQIIVYGPMNNPDTIKAWTQAPTRLRKSGARILRVTDRTGELPEGK